MAVFIGALMVLASFGICDGHGKYLSSVYGEVGKGNITHFSMAYQGTVLLELTSLTGDCDLYVSQFTIRPTYEPHSYCLQSMTCGVDTIVVPKSFKRPIGIGIFGYPTHTNCKYHLVFHEIDDVLDVFNHDYFSDSLTPSKNDKLVDTDAGLNPVPEKDEVKVRAGKGEGGEVEDKSESASASGSDSVDGGTGQEIMKEVKEKRRTKKLGEPEKDTEKMKRRRKSYEGESYFWLFLDYLIDCLIELIL